MIWLWLPCKVMQRRAALIAQCRCRPEAEHSSFLPCARWLPSWSPFPLAWALLRAHPRTLNMCRCRRLRRWVGAPVGCGSPGGGGSCSSSPQQGRRAARARVWQLRRQARARGLGFAGTGRAAFASAASAAGRPGQCTCAPAARVWRAAGGLADAVGIGGRQRVHVGHQCRWVPRGGCCC